MAQIITAPTLDAALTALREWVKKGEERGQKNFIFCEDKLTLLAERAILKELGGTLDSEVSTFARFLAGSGRALSKQGSIMQVSAILADREKELSCFKRNAAETVYETIAQLSASRVNAALLREGAEQSEGILQRKLFELALVQEEYEAFLAKNGLLDENGFLALLPEKIEQVLCGYNVCFFAFPSFTKQAQEGIRAAVESAASVTGIFVGGEGDFYTNESSAVFHRICKEYGDVCVSERESELSSDALRLKNGLFSPDVFAYPPVKTENVKIFERTDEEEELRAVAALVKQEVGERGLRYRDIAVLVPSEESFSTVKKVFSSYKIPFFADEKRSLAEHPFARLLLSALDGVCSGVLPAEADAIASSVYFGRGDNYRNYLLKYGAYRGGARRDIKEGEPVARYDRNELIACREKMLAILDCFPKTASVDAYCEGVRALYALVEGERITAELSAKVEGAEREFLQLDALWRMLGEMQSVAGERALPAREFYSMLLNGLQALSVSLIPQSQDAVFVGDATESRFARVKTLFATGLTSALPRASGDDSVITDGEIKRLSQLQVQIEPAIAQVNARARETIALNLCAFDERLYLSYPLRARSEETTKSEIIAYANAIFHCSPVFSSLFYECCELQPALIKTFSLRDDLERGKLTDRRKYELLLGVAKGERALAERIPQGDGKKRNITLGKQIYMPNDRLSPTLLETYFNCPYQSFMMKGLSLQEREERSVAGKDTGIFIHSVLEKVCGRFNGMTSETECGEVAREIATDLLRSPRYLSLNDTKEGEYAAQQLIDEAVTVSVAAYRQIARSTFRVSALEKWVNVPRLSLSGKVDRVDEDAHSGLVRVIDYKTGEIDVSASAYYTGRKLQLPLYLRAVATKKYDEFSHLKGDKKIRRMATVRLNRIIRFRIRRNSELREPAGAFYFPAVDEFTSPDEPKFRLRGIYVKDKEIMKKFDCDLQDKQRSALFNGTFGQGSGSIKSAMEREQFNDYLKYSVLVAAKAEGEMKRGNVAPSPYVDGCKFCKLKGACAFDGAERKETDVSYAAVANVARKTRGDV